MEIEALNQKINELEQESINSLKMDAGLEKRLLGIELAITKRYADTNSPQYIGENPVWGAYVDYELQKVVVFVDPKYEEASKITRIIIEQYGTDSIQINNEVPKLTACSSQTSECRPLIGGIAISRDYDPNQLAGTLGYKARDSSGNIGFVTAGHVVDFWNNGNTWMRQPVGGSLVGFATIEQQGGSNLDFAFVQTITTINDDIFQSSNQVMDVTSYASSSEHAMGTFLYMKGVSSGELSGRITGTSSTGWYVTDMNPVEGDSGGPVYKKFAGAHGTFTVKIFGHMLNNAGIYGSVHGVNAMYGVTPLTT